MFCWHKWTKWQEYTRTIHVKVVQEFPGHYYVGRDPKDNFVATKQYWQSRTCEKCGKTEREEVC
jgi:hypothetical protein